VKTGTTAVNGWASPLRDIEIAAQGRAKAESLDMESAGAVDRLRQLLAEEVETWRSEYRRGRRPVDIADPAMAIERALKNLAGYGPLEALLADPDVWEIMI
jgi:pilus assembly protein CpaF